MSDNEKMDTQHRLKIFKMTSELGEYIHETIQAFINLNKSQLNPKDMFICLTIANHHHLRELISNLLRAIDEVDRIKFLKNEKNNLIEIIDEFLIKEKNEKYN